MIPKVLWWMCRPPTWTFLNGPFRSRIACVIARVTAKVLPKASELMKRRS